ncbi:hypothetical protein CCACVL1_19297 [Corchorus capsularis]|uniref:Oberon coiled-coil region domain-containing protein n=1 Tax=Corchorus capsularis TaxID=210143 RepID=A0A1R3HHJ0_COCAP|nr:hypothetical protein CCACVL1_19297 [Corchorus capsularis]
MEEGEFEPEPQAAPQPELATQGEIGNDAKEASHKEMENERVERKSTVAVIEDGNKEIGNERIDEEKEDVMLGDSDKSLNDGTSGSGDKVDDIAAEVGKEEDCVKANCELKEDSSKDAIMHKSSSLEENCKEDKGINLEMQVEECQAAVSNEEVADENGEEKNNTDPIPIEMGLSQNIKDKGKGVAVEPTNVADSAENGVWVEGESENADVDIEGPSTRGFELFSCSPVKKVEKAEQSGADKQKEGSSKMANGLERQLSFHKQNDVRSPSQSVGSHEIGSTYSFDKKRAMREKHGGSLYRSTSQKEQEQLLIGGADFVETIISRIVSEPIHVMARKFHAMTGQSIACLKESIREVMLNADKHGQLRSSQEALRNRSDLILETLLKSHRAQLEILVALKTGLPEYLQVDNSISSSDLAEIFLNLRELEYVKRIFSGSKDVRGKRLHEIASHMLVRLSKKSDLPEVYSQMMDFLSDSDNFKPDSDYSKPGKAAALSGKEQGKGINGVAGPSQDTSWLKSVYSDKAPQLESSPSLLPSLHVDRTDRPDKRPMESDLQRSCEKQSFMPELESFITIKQEEAMMYQTRADDARKEAEGLKRIVMAKYEKIEEEYMSKVTRLRLVEAEEMRKQKLEEFEAVERAYKEYYSMKTRMEADIKDLLLKMEATRRNLSM